MQSPTYKTFLSCPLQQEMQYGLQSRSLCNNSRDAVCFKYFMKYQVEFSGNLGFVRSRG